MDRIMRRLAKKNTTKSVAQGNRSQQVVRNISTISPLRFSTKRHGKHIVISSDGTSALRVSPGGDEGTVFSSRPVKVDEKVCLRITNDWHGDIRFGFTAQDPSNNNSDAQHWAMYLDLLHAICENENSLYYYVNSAGQLYYGLNGKDKGCFFSGVDVKRPLWVFMVIHGERTSVQLIDSNESNTEPVQSPVDAERMISEIRSLSVEDPLPQLIYNGRLIPLSMHTTKGRNIQLCSNFAARIKGTVSQGYVFTAYPMQPSQTIVIQIFSVQTSLCGRTGGLAYGLTSCDPATLRQCDLPDHTYQLLDRQEFWFVSEPAAEALREGDELAMTLSVDGQVKESRNNSDPITVMQVDQRRPLWAFVDLYETTQKVRMLVTYPGESVPRGMNKLNAISATTSRHASSTSGDISRVISNSACTNFEATSSIPRNVIQRSSIVGPEVFASISDADKETTAVGQRVDAPTRTVGRDTTTAAGHGVVTTTRLTGRVTTTAVGQDVGATTSVAGRAETIEAGRQLGATTSIAGRATNAAAQHVGSRTNMTSRKINTTPRNKTHPTASNADIPKEWLPRRFHTVHGDSIRISSDGSVAERLQSRGHESYECEVFSARPVKVNEKIYFRFMKISNDWRSTIQYGYTNHDPAIRTNWKRDWLQTLDRRRYQKDIIIYYYVNSKGDEIHCGVHGEINKSIEHLNFRDKIETSSFLWVKLLIKGIGTAVQFVEPNAINPIMRPIQSPAAEVVIGDCIEDPLPQLIYQGTLIPLSLHTTKGKNIHLRSEFAIRTSKMGYQGYVFTALPMLPSQTFVIQIISVQTNSAGISGGLAYGLTSCNPASLRPCDLPDDADQLLDRPEYWVVNTNAAEALHRGDELAITLTLDGQVQESRNNSNPITVMHVDHTLKLWAFVDLYETTREVRMLITPPVEYPRQSRVPRETVPHERPERPSTSHQPQNFGNSSNQANKGQNSNDADCSICFDKQIDCALYKCGHMCMCYMCALQVWKDGDGGCPICRAKIMEVIRIYKS